MSNAFYATARASFADGQINWLSDTVRAQLLDGAHYAPAYDSQGNVTGAQFLSDISGTAFVGQAIALAGKASTAGVLDATSPVVIPLVSGALSSYVLVYQDTGVAGTSRLILLMDTAAGLPVLPNGSDIDIYWDSGQFRIGVV